MKEIKNWEAIVEKDGEENIALPLPGCIIKGELDNQSIKFEAIQIDLSKLTVTANDGESYLLYGAKDSYLGILDSMIEIGKNKEINIQSIDLNSEIENEER